MRVSRPLREFDDLYKALCTRRYPCRLDPVYGPAALRVEASAPIAAAMLLVFEAHAVHLAPGLLLEVAGLPVPDLAGDIDALDLWIDRSLDAAGALLQIIGDVHLVRAALVFRFGAAITGLNHVPVPTSRHSRRRC